MSVYFVFWSIECGPSGVKLKTFEETTLLEWFRERWPPSYPHDRAQSWSEENCGQEVYALDDLYDELVNQRLRRPLSEAEFLNAIQQCGDGLQIHETDAIQITCWDGDEGYAGAYLFDETYLHAHRDRVAFLLRENWHLPHTFAKDPVPFQSGETVHLLPDGKGTAGDLYGAILTFWGEKNTPPEIECWKIPRLRLPGLPKWLATNDSLAQLTPELLMLRAVLFAENPYVDESLSDAERSFDSALENDPQDDATWCAWSDWCYEHGHGDGISVLLHRAFAHATFYPLLAREFDIDLTSLTTTTSLVEAVQPLHTLFVEEWYELDDPDRDPSLSLIQVEEHVAQICHNVSADVGEGPGYVRWILFDDLWASQHSDLAHSVLRCANRWDVLIDAP